jgi:hypothetical protein
VVKGLIDLKLLSVHVVVGIVAIPLPFAFTKIPITFLFIPQDDRVALCA